ncbi:MAG: hypothetical protein ACKV2O_10835 [Acidimicrobiales bacterium]
MAAPGGAFSGGHAASHAESLAPDPELDAAERALLLAIYRELVGTAEGPIVPFPVELMADPAERAERSESAAVVDLDEFRARRRADHPPEPTESLQ